MTGEQPIIFFNVGWMKNYQGITSDDRPERGGGWVGEHGWDHAMLNFQPRGAFYYGYGQGGETGVKLERLGARPGSEEIDGVTVVWVSTRADGGSVIVGWYKDAILFRDYQTPDPDLGRTWDGQPVYFNARTKISEGELLPPEKRVFKIPRGKGGMGQSNVWYADKHDHQEFKKLVREYIGTGGESKTPAEPKAWIVQANPKLYNIDAALASLPEMTWLVTAYKDQISPGDKVYFWRSGRQAGLIGEGVVLTAPTLMEEDSEPSELTLQPDKFKGPAIRVKLQILESFGLGISREIVKTDSRLANLSILRSSQGTNFPVTMEEASAIRDLVDRTELLESDDIGPGPEAGTTAGRVWAYSPGPAARYWEEFYRNGIIGIGWDELGDLAQYGTLEAFASALKTIYKLQHEPINDSRACYDFVHAIKPGDRIIAKRGRDQIIGFGVVIGEYHHAAERSYYRNIRSVRWERRGL